MLREARKGARGEKARGGYMGSVVKGGWLAASVVTRGVVAGIRYSYTGACRWGVKGSFERYISGIWAGTISSSIAFERTVLGGEVSSATSRVARKASRRWERCALSVNGEVHSNGLVVTIAELEGGEGRASMSNSTVEIDAVNRVWEGSFSTSRGGITGDRNGAGEAVHAARPVSGDTSRTSISEGKAGEEEPLDIIQDGAGAPLWQKYGLTSKLVSHINEYGYSTGTQKVQKLLI